MGSDLAVPPAEGALAMTPAQRRSWDEDGFVVLPDFFDASELAALLRAADRLRDRWCLAKGLVDGAPLPEHGFSVRNLLAYDDAFLGLVDHPKILPLVVDAIGPNIQIRTSHLDFRPPYPPALQAELRARLQADPAANGVPGARNVGWHPDLAGLFAQANELNGVLPFMEIKAFYTLGDMRAANCGNLWLAAGSHRRELSELQAWKAGAGDSGAPPPGAVELRLPAGAAVLWRTACWHCVGPNLSALTRKIIHVGYHHRWLRPTDYNEQDPALLTRCSPVRQQLLGAVPSGNGLGTDPFEPTSAYYRSFDEDVPLKAWAERLGHVTAARGVGSVGSPSASGFSGGARAGAKL
jgi:hypothetical protein